MFLYGPDTVKRPKSLDIERRTTYANDILSKFYDTSSKRHPWDLQTRL